MKYFILSLKILMDYMHICSNAYNPLKIHKSNQIDLIAIAVG